MSDDESTGDTETPPLQRLSTADDRTEVDLSTGTYGIYRCPDCENVVLSMRDCDGDIACHGDPMERVTDLELDVRPPDIRQVLLDVFGLPKAGLDICLCVIDEGPVSPGNLAERLDYDESTIRKYLNDLVEFGLLERSQLNRERGGFVNVYHSIDVEEMREETLVGFYAWAGEAASLIEEANLTKADYLDSDYSEGLEEVFWDQFDDDVPDS